MALGGSGRPRQPLKVTVMLLALIVAAFLGAAAGLVWQGQDWFNDELEEEVVTANKAPA